MTRDASGVSRTTLLAVGCGAYFVEIRSATRGFLGSHDGGVGHTGYGLLRACRVKPNRANANQCGRRYRTTQLSLRE
jgi:hypothetical protein